MSSHSLVSTFDKERQVLRVEWTIEDYKTITANSLKSETFSHSSAPPEWELEVFPEGDWDKADNCMSLYLNLCWDSNCTASFLFGYKDKKGSSSFNARLSNAFDANEGFGFSQFVSTKDVKANLLRDDGSLTLLLEIDYATLEWCPITQLMRYKVGNDLGMALDGQHADVVFQVGTLSIKAHKVILAYRSKYFQTMFDSNSSEAQTGVITITDLEYAVVRGLLEFIYSGAIELTNVGFAISLRIAADKYELLPLVEICEDYIVSNVDKTTASKAILSTILVDSDRIREACLEVFMNRVDYDDIDNFQEVFDNPIICKFVVNANVVPTYTL